MITLAESLKATLISNETRITSGYIPDEFKFRDFEVYTNGFSFHKISDGDIFVTHVFHDKAFVYPNETVWIRQQFRLSSVRNPLAQEDLRSFMKVAEEEKKLRQAKQAEDPWF